MTHSRLRIITLAAEQNSGSIYQELQAIGRGAGPITTLGAVSGLVLAAIAKTLYPNAEISYGGWIGYSSALAGLFALSVEIASRAG
jgi:hypothetical protein